MTQNIEKQIIEVIAADRISIPIKSMAGKLDRKKPKLAKAIDLTEYEDSFTGDRVYARIESSETMKTRGTREAIEEFKRDYPRHGDILEGYIQGKRLEREKNLYFGVNSGSRLTSEDYMGVMRSLGFSETAAENLYPELMNVSRNLSRKRDEERSITIG